MYVFIQTYLLNQTITINAPLSSLMDSTTSPKVKTTEGKGVGARCLVHNTSRVEGCAGAPRWDQDKRQVVQLFTWTYTNQTISQLVHSGSTFSARTNHGQTWTHKTRHGPDLGEATTVRRIVYFVLGHGTNTQMSFCPRVPKFPKLGLSQLWRLVTLCENLQLM